ncbi:MAG: hypothetical protein EA398_01455 [Deltaproteobacteria bacterium]|nr:MAG: hypothetical protein EA398_01455 [Deltaproteobacteria bacterium]
MLALLREHSRSWLIWAIFIVLILVFIFFFGPQTEGFAPSDRTWAVRAPGATIYDTQINATLYRFEPRSGARMDDATFQARRRQIALNLALVHALADRAEREGLAVGQDEVSCFIVNWDHDYLRRGVPVCERFPAAYRQLYRNMDLGFYANETGQLAESFRQDVRANFNMSVEEYEAWKGRELLALRYVETLATALRVPPSAVRSSWERRNDRVQLEVLPLRLTTEAFEPSELEITETMLLRDQELLSRYEAELDRFRSERTVRLQRIYLRKPLDDDEEALEALRARAEQIMNEARLPGADFAALVAEHSDLASEHETGGDMGARTEETLDRSLWEATLDLAEGEVTLVEQSGSFTVIRLSESRPSGTLPFEDVSAVLAEELLIEERRAASRQSLGDRGRRIIEIAMEQDVSLQDAAALEVVERSSEHPEEEVALLAAEVTDSFARERSPQRFDELGPEFVGFTLPASPPDEIPGVGRSVEMARVAFELRDDSPVHPEPIRVGEVDYLVRLQSRERPESAPDPEALQAIEDELRSALVESVVGPAAFRSRVLAHQGDSDLAPLLRGILEEEITNRRIRLRDRVFRVDPALVDD